ncbi:MAG: MFS transporter [Candidatus Thermoplasmatota archaeon]|nr:MFS transporter [Candidatus Thermoplasmatota archaeon]
MTPQGRILTSVSMIHAVNDAAVTVIAILFPVFKDLFTLSYTEVGIITGGGLFLTLVGQLILGRLADGKNVDIFLHIGILFTCIALLLLTFSSNYLTLLLFVFLLRFATAFFHPIGTGWISRTYKRGKLDWAMGIQSGAADIGVFTALATTLFISELTHWTIPLFIWAVLGTLILLLSLGLTTALEKSLLIVPRDTTQHSVKETLHDAMKRIRSMRRLVPAFVISGACWGIIVTYLPLLLTEKTTYSLPLIGVLIALWAVVGSLASLSYGTIQSYVGRKKLLLISYILIGSISLALAVVTTLWILIILMILLGIAVFLTYPALASFISEVTHESVEGWTFGLTFTFQTGGGTILLFAGGLLADLIGIWMPFALLGALTLLFSLVLLVNYSKPFAQPS